VGCRAIGLPNAYWSDPLDNTWTRLPDMVDVNSFSTIPSFFDHTQPHRRSVDRFC
jgi:hypothetical protein